MHYWNLYFLLKVALFYRGYLGFHWALNLALGAALAWPLTQGRWRRLRNVLAVPAALALLYHDSFLMAALRDGAILVVAIVFAYSLLARRIRFATLALAGILSVPIVSHLSADPVETIANSATATADGQPTTPDGLLKTFYAAQSRLHLQLQRSETAAAPFDIVVLHVCSLSWDDMAFVGMRQHPLLQRFDVVFSNFNSAASYSGPASLRLLHGTCGQQAHTQIYDSEEPSCYVFPSLEKLGYQTQALLNHDGVYEGFGATLEEKGGLAGKFLPNQNAAVHMQNFDGSPIYNDYALLSQWWQKRLSQGGAPVALYYNTISLHDGNRVPGMTSRSSLDTYKPRLMQLLTDLDRFISELEAAEHGAALRGNKMQISGMREIPSPNITLVPTAVKLIGLKNSAAGDAGTSNAPLVVDTAMSYLDLFTLLSDWLADSPYAAQPLKSLAERVAKLPGTRFVSENADVITMRNEADQYLLKSGNDPWIRYTP